MPRFAAAVLGASSEQAAGHCVVRSLLAEPKCTTILVFDTLDKQDTHAYYSEPRVKQRFVDMDKLATDAVPFLQEESVRVCFITTGVGRGSKVAREILEKIDLEIPTAFAKACKAAGCVRHVSLLSCADAHPAAKASRLAGKAAGSGLYLRVKGKAERNFEEIGLESAAIFRPANLVGNETLPTSGLATLASRLVLWTLPLKKRKEVHVDALSTAMVKVAVASLDDAGPVYARYEGKALFCLLP